MNKLENAREYGIKVLDFIIELNSKDIKEDGWFKLYKDAVDCAIRLKDEYSSNPILVGLLYTGQDLVSLIGDSKETKEKLIDYFTNLKEVILNNNEVVLFDPVTMRDTLLDLGFITTKEREEELEEKEFQEKRNQGNDENIQDDKFKQPFIFTELPYGTDVNKLKENMKNLKETEVKKSSKLKNLGLLLGIGGAVLAAGYGIYKYVIKE